MSVHPARKTGHGYLAALTQPFADAVVDNSHEEALFAFGEWCLFTLMWRPHDHKRGLVGRCPVCWEGPLQRQAEAFQQATQRECPACFGTTFEGGFRAQIIRPALWSDRNQEISEEARGYTLSDTLLAETTGDFVLHKGDYVFRGDNSRYQVEEKREVIMRSGFVTPATPTSIGGGFTGHLEDPTSPAFRIPPIADPALAEMKALLATPGPFKVENMAVYDVIAENGYL